ncbi:ParB-like partition proteins [Ruminococcus champanellensis 18P13 = JCM 17042]|uniref:ParB-like partition proteins n=3 Tax=Ruminococcus TaxID=1263 RepID=D4LA98_RUMC1|nr:ParB-like partition proteins [Ruminococcus champanellensis 18P13 = JCM 17042]
MGHIFCYNWLTDNRGKEQKMGTFLGFTREKNTTRVIQVAPEEILPNPHQPRTEFEEVEILSLAESIQQNGLLQPLSVRKLPDGYELIAGERRLRAARELGLPTVPCIVFDVSDRTSAILSLVENIQRQNLNFFDEAAAIQRLIASYGMTQEDAAVKLGRAQSTVANKLRLLKISEPHRALILKYGLTERHARALLKLSSLEDRETVLQQVIKRNLNVEKTEQLIADLLHQQKERESYRQRSPFFQNVRIFVNTIQKAVETMQAAGIQADARKIQHDDFVEYRVYIPVVK